MSSKRDEAAGLMDYYLRTVWRAAGLKWTRDNTAEAQALTDALIDAAIERMDEREARKHE